MLTQERLKELLDYDPETGEFIRRISRHKHRAGEVAGYVDSGGYIQIKIDGCAYLAHRLAWFYVYGEWPQHQIDHRDTDRANNRIDNFRPATNRQNAANQNRPRNNTSGQKGVFWHKKNQKWVAKITVNYKQMHLCSSDSYEECCAAYVAAAERYFGEFARAA